MKKNILYFSISLLLSTNLILAQEELQLTSKDSLVLSSWVVGLGINIVDDTATPFGEQFLNIDDTWNMVPYPSRISIGRFFKSGIGLEAIGTYNKYKVGKLIDGKINQAPRDYFAIDGKISYDMNKLVGQTGWFDPYVHVGAGYSSIGGLGRSTANAGFGFNTWFSDTWGLNFNTMGKWGIPEGSTKQLQHSAGVVYQFAVEKGLSKKGLEKQALIEAMEKEKQRVQDSIAAADRARDEAALAERFAKEKENARLAAAKKDSIEALQREWDKLQKEINDLGYVYFALNSSLLNLKSKNVLDQLAIVLKNTPNAEIEVRSYTDSRGTADYNQSLSELRAKTTTDYLFNKGIPKHQLSYKGFGETNLLNRCSDGVKCTESEHRLNRRSEFILKSY